MEDVLQRIEQKIDTMGGRLESVEVQLGTVDRRLTGLEGGQTAILGRLGTVESSLSGLTETVHQQGLRQENLIDKVTATMEGLEGGRQAMDKRFDEVMKKLDERVTPIELATRYLATKKGPRRG
jgi:archaellum component FlaC